MTTAQQAPTQRLHPRLHLRKALALAAVIGLGATLAACGPDAEPSSPTAAPSSSAAATSASPTPVPSSSPTASPAEATPSSTASAPGTGETPLCPAASLQGALDDAGGGAAGHVYMRLVVTNSSTATCILDGYSGVSLIKAGTTTPIGAPAVRDPQAPSNGPISLAPGQSAAATLRYTQAGNYQECQHTAADAVLVYPPSATDSLEIAHPLTACANAEIKLLSIGAFQS